MKRNVIVGMTLVVIVVVIIIGGICLLKRKTGDENQMNKVIIEELQNKYHDSNFNFETRTVKLNSGYEMPLNGIVV